MKKKYIYIAYTGGTIGMVKSKNGYIPKYNYLKKQLFNTKEFYSANLPHFYFNEYYPLIDSSNMTPKDWKTIADDIKKNYIYYDGFIILHGTDTMAYTASALSFILENLNKPVIITGSQIPISEVRSDGKSNLLNSLFIANYYPVNEVTIFFHNVLYRGNRTTKASAYGFNAFISPNFPPLIKTGINIKTMFKKNKKSDKKLKIRSIVKQPIGIITIYPGIDTQIINNFLLQPVKALIICSYGIGNAPQNNNFINKLKEAVNKKNIVIINLTQCIKGKVNMKNYATGHSLIKAGVISGYDLTLEATITKLQFLLSNKKLSFKKICKKMQKNLRGELTP
ncbi:asparaginase [Buchnera aphidicola (Taiwanaphis decaspermi)]|uniref:asparaginase n=1 Tax=Buchnera aphidicola TaxID=9 RepID=UPI0031B8062E